jgi:GNAT superfamily N-acetyltransferase
MRGKSISSISSKESIENPRSSQDSYQIIHPELDHGLGIYEVICLANDFDPSGFVPGVFGLGEDWADAVTRFPDGQFIAVTEVQGKPKVVGLALSIRTDYQPSAKPLSWREMIGDLSLKNHNPKGRWLYGVEKAVHPDYQGRGIGSALYKAQFSLIKRYNLRGMYAGGMLKGYKHYRHRMSIQEYAGKVMRGEIFDPTVSVQMKKGFKARTIIENYSWDHEANHTGMLIVYEPRPRQSSETAKAAVTVRV